MHFVFLSFSFILFDEPHIDITDHAVGPTHFVQTLRDENKIRGFTNGFDESCWNWLARYILNHSTTINYFLKVENINIPSNW